MVDLISSGSKTFQSEGRKDVHQASESLTSDKAKGQLGRAHIVLPAVRQPAA